MTLDELSKEEHFNGIGAGGSLTLDPLEIRREKPSTAVRDTIEITQTSHRGESLI